MFELFFSKCQIVVFLLTKNAVINHKNFHLSNNRYHRHSLIMIFYRKLMSSSLLKNNRTSLRRCVSTVSFHSLCVCVFLQVQSSLLLTHRIDLSYSRQSLIDHFSDFSNIRKKCSIITMLPSL